MNSYSKLLVIMILILIPAAAQTTKDDNLSWWREARFGMFIHWGLYAVPAGEWKGQPIPGIGEWIMNRAKIPVKEYERLADSFNPVKFNADEWVGIAKAAGQKYIVITSKHHDGFAMFRSPSSKYNIFDATPFHRDPMAELAAACKKNGIRLCFYYSQTQDWHHPDGAANTWDYDESKKDFRHYLDTLVKPQVREILTQYGPIGLIWFDTPQKMTKEQSLELRDLVHSIQPRTLVSGRVGNDVGDYRSMGDNQIPVKVMDYDWETPVTLNDTWGFKKDDHNWKSTQTLIRQLVDVASKNGNYLLNVGPTSEGLIPQPSVDRLKEVGQWLKTNGEAVYGARPSPFPYEFEWGSITSKPGRLYLHIIDWPSNGNFELYGVKGKVKKAYLLAARGKSLAVKQSDAPAGGSLRIQLPSVPPDKNVSTVALEFDSQPSFEKGLIQQPDGKVTLSCIFAEQNEPKVNVDNRGVAMRWTDPAGSMTWDFTVFKPGRYNVVAVSSEGRSSFSRTPDWEGGHRVNVSVAGQSIEAALADNGRSVNARNPLWRDVRSDVGQVEISKAGQVKLMFKPVAINTEKKMGLMLRALELSPAGEVGGRR